MPATSFPTFASAMITDNEWHIRIGDPSPIGWLTTATYLVAAYLAHTAHKASRDDALRGKVSGPREAENLRLLAELWLIMAAAMLILGINKQFALLSLFVEALRDLAQKSGWYVNRRHYQAIFVWAAASIGVIGVSLMLYRFRAVLRRAAGTVLALNYMVFFVIVRASSFHPIDQFLYGNDSFWNRTLEFGGLGAVTISALRARRAAMSN